MGGKNWLFGGPVDLMALAQQIQQKAIERSFPLLMRDVAARQFSGIPSLFQPFAEMPKAEAFQPAIDELGVVLGQLSAGHVETNSTNPGAVTAYPANPELTHIDAVTRCVSTWTGEAAEAFADNFLDPFPATVANQFILTYALHEALKGAQAIWARAQDDIIGIGNNTLEALDGLGGGCDSNAWSVAFSVVGAVAAIATIPLTGGVSAGEAALTIVGATSGVAGSLPGAGMGFSGGSVPEIISSMTDAISQLTRYVSDTHNKIATELNKTYETVQANRHLFTLVRPALAGATPGTIKTDMGVPRY